MGKNASPKPDNTPQTSSEAPFTTFIQLDGKSPVPSQFRTPGTFTITRLQSPALDDEATDQLPSCQQGTCADQRTCGSRSSLDASVDPYHCRFSQDHGVMEITPVIYCGGRHIEVPCPERQGVLGLILPCFTSRVVRVDAGLVPLRMGSIDSGAGAPKRSRSFQRARFSVTRRTLPQCESQSSKSAFDAPDIDLRFPAACCAALVTARQKV
jgi:hypothetical protein